MCAYSSYRPSRARVASAGTIRVAVRRAPIPGPAPLAKTTIAIAAIRDAAERVLGCRLHVHRDVRVLELEAAVFGHEHALHLLRAVAPRAVELALEREPALARL